MRFDALNHCVARFVLSAVFVAGCLVTSGCGEPGEGVARTGGVSRDDQSKRQRDPYKAADADLKNATK